MFIEWIGVRCYSSIEDWKINFLDSKLSGLIIKKKLN